MDVVGRQACGLIEQVMMMMTMIMMMMKMTMIRRPTETLKLLLGEAICCLFWGIYVHLRSREMSSTGFLGS